MIIGHDNLLELYPNFKEDIKENGIDLRIGSVEHIIHKKGQVIGCIDDEKHLPKTYKVKPVNDSYYLFLPHNHYTITVDRPIHIPNGYCQLYYIRSTFARCGIILSAAVGDNGYNGTLQCNIYNASNQPVRAGVNERIVQAITIKNDETATLYNGTYQGA